MPNKFSSQHRKIRLLKFHWKETHRNRKNNKSLKSLKLIKMKESINRGSWNKQLFRLTHSLLFHNKLRFLSKSWLNLTLQVVNNLNHLILQGLKISPRLKNLVKVWPRKFQRIKKKLKMIKVMQNIKRTIWCFTQELACAYLQLYALALHIWYRISLEGSLWDRVRIWKFLII